MTHAECLHVVFSVADGDCEATERHNRTDIAVPVSGGE